MPVAFSYSLFLDLCVLLKASTCKYTEANHTTIFLNRFKAEFSSVLWIVFDGRKVIPIA